jgi:hypothetical protein
LLIGFVGIGAMTYRRRSLSRYEIGVYPHLISARLSAAIILDDFERNALIFAEQVGIH